MPQLRELGALVRPYVGAVDALLLGEHQDRSDLPSLLSVGVVADEGLKPWVTISCRDRNRAVIEADLHGYAELEVFAVHCVTGDARAPYLRPDITQVFDLDSVRLTDLVARRGLSPSVAETPLAPPVAARPARTATKCVAGAQYCFVNHSGGPEPVRRFVAAALAAGAHVGFIPCVAVITDPDVAHMLAALPGVVIDPEQVRAITVAPDPVEAGIAAAVASAQAMLAIPGVVGVNLSGPGTADPSRRAQTMTEVAKGLRR